MRLFSRTEFLTTLFLFGVFFGAASCTLCLAGEGCADLRVDLGLLSTLLTTHSFAGGSFAVS